MKAEIWQVWMIKGIFRLFSWLPLRLNHALGAFLGYLLYLIPNNVRRVSAINLKIAFPEYTELEHQSVLKASLLELGKTATELGPLWLGSPTRTLKYIRQVNGEAALEDAFKQGKGVILLSPHLGSWEAIGLYWSAKYPVTYLYRPPNLAALEHFVVQARSRMGAKLAPTDVSGVIRLRKALKNNEVLGILPDQDPGDSGGIYADFFRHPARTMGLVAKLAAKSGCAIFFNYAERLPKGQGYVLHILPADNALADKDEAIALKALNEGIEACVRQCPTQYQWSYKRFKHPPKGVADVYQKP